MLARSRNTSLQYTASVPIMGLRAISMFHITELGTVASGLKSSWVSAR